MSDMNMKPEDEVSKTKTLSEEEIRKAIDICRIEIEKRFLDYKSDPMIKVFFDAVLKHAVKRHLAGRPC